MQAKHQKRMKVLNLFKTPIQIFFVVFLSLSMFLNVKLGYIVVAIWQGVLLVWVLMYFYMEKRIDSLHSFIDDDMMMMSKQQDLIIDQHTVIDKYKEKYGKL